jgi:cytochrome c-type biogenesis protein
MSEFARLALFAVPAGLIGFAAAPCCGLLGPVYLPFALGTATTPPPSMPIRELPLVGQPVATGPQGRPPAATPDQGQVAIPTATAETAPTAGTLRSYLAFSAGFCVFFTLLGISASAIGTFLLNQLPLLAQAAGIFILALGIAMVLRLRLALPGRNRCLDTTRLRGGTLGPFGMGLAVAVAWTPCTGPTLGAILALAATTPTAWQGGALLLLYAVGLSLPFGLMALTLTKAPRLRSFQQRHQATLERLGGALMIAVGAALLLGGWQRWLGPLTAWLSSHGWPPI